MLNESVPVAWCPVLLPHALTTHSQQCPDRAACKLLGAHQPPRPLLPQQQLCSHPVPAGPVSQPVHAVLQGQQLGACRCDFRVRIHPPQAMRFAPRDIPVTALQAGRGGGGGGGTRYLVMLVNHTITLTASDAMSRVQPLCVFHGTVCAPSRALVYVATTLCVYPLG